jgi:hypothetical protein
MFIALVEWKFALEFKYRLNSHFLTSTYHKTQMDMYIVAMFFIPAPLLIGILEFLAIEKKMRCLGADENAIVSLQKAMGMIFSIGYMILLTCVGSMSDLLPLQ